MKETKYIEVTYNSEITNFICIPISLSTCNMYDKKEKKQH